MIRLLHLADVHLGRAFTALGTQGASQRRALAQALERAVDLALADQVHLVLVAGDLFDGPRPAPATVDEVVRQFRRLVERGIGVAVAGGNHDVGADGRIGAADRLGALGPRVMIFGREVQTHILPQLDLTVVGRSADPGRSESPLSGWPRQRTTRLAVGVTHGSVFRPGQVDTPGVIHPLEIRELGLDYLALGDWHSAQEVVGPPTAAWYSGAPELLAVDQEGPGCVLRVDIAAPGQAEVRPVPVGRRRYRRVVIDLSDADDAGVRARLDAAADADTVCDVVLTGLVPVHRVVDPAAWEREYGDRFFRLRVRWRAQIQLADEELDALPADSVLGRFVRVMRDRLAAADEAQRPILEEALQVGVALLQGREVLA
ncbi:MAG: DNA repair exonuclease [Armatimonadota bacterium]|nr:DNA repair exonuclease [Armatimonadota bacterium]